MLPLRSPRILRGMALILPIAKLRLLRGLVVQNPGERSLYLCCILKDCEVEVIGWPRRATPTFTARGSTYSSVNVGVALRGHPHTELKRVTAMTRRQL
jgi:hypothetical protein